jgi:hypothetical protein
MKKSHPVAASLVGLGLCCGVAMAEPTSSPAAGSGLEGVIVIAPAHPGPSRVGVADSAPLAHTAFIVQIGNETIASFTTDAQGTFRISLAAGHYTISRKDPAPRIGRFGPFEVDLVEGQITKVNWTCDTGMR